MNMETFINDLREAIELEDEIILESETEFRSLQEWDSLAVLSTMAMVTTNYDKVIVMEDIDNCKTVTDLFNLTQTA